MTATSGFSAFGTTLKWNGIALAELQSIGGPRVSVDTVDLTSHDSDDKFKEFVAGLRDGGEISIDGNFIPGDTPGQRAFITDMKAGTERQVIITGPVAAAFTWTFQAIVTGFEPSYPFDGKIGFTATLKVTGKPALDVTISDDVSAMVFNDSEGVVATDPVFAVGTYEGYDLTIVLHGVYVQVTVGYDIANSTIIATALGIPHVLTHDTMSEQIVVTEDKSTILTVEVKEKNKVAKTYTITVISKSA